MAEQSWNDLEQPILEAVAALEGEKRIIFLHDVAERTGLPVDRVGVGVRRLLGTDLLDGKELVDGDQYEAAGLRLLAEGRRAIGQWPAAPSTATVDDRMSRRLMLMDALYEEVGDNTRANVAVDQLAPQLGWTSAEASPVVEYLRAQGLLERHMGNRVSITNAGIVEVERSRLEPDEPTEHLPPSNAVYIGGSAENLQITVGSPGSSQHLVVNESNMDTARAFVEEFRRVFEGLPLGDHDRAAAMASLVAAESFLAAPEPNGRALGGVLGALRELTFGVAGNAAFAGLVELGNRLV